jgi:hypothetical protein
VGFEELYDGDERWLEPGTWPGWTKPHLRVSEIVEVDGWTGDALETADIALVPVPVPDSEVSVWYGEDGWSAFAIMTREVAALLGAGAHGDAVGVGPEIEQHVVRDESWNVKSRHQKVHIHWVAVDGDGEFVDIDAPEGL